MRQTALIQASLALKRKPAAKETEKGFALAPDKKDLNSWYSTRSKDPADAKQGEEDEEKRRRDSLRKSTLDTLTSITKQLSPRSPSKPNNTFKRPSLLSSSSTDPIQVRIARESSERERALALIRLKQKEMQGRENETPNPVHGGELDDYGDVYNRREVEEARKERERQYGARSPGRDERRDKGGWGDRRRESFDDGRMDGGRSRGRGWEDDGRSSRDGE